MLYLLSNKIQVIWLFVVAAPFFLNKTGGVVFKILYSYKSDKL